MLAVSNQNKVIRLPLIRDGELLITKEDVRKLIALHPHVSVIDELYSIKRWLESNPRRCKTKNGTLKFIHRWLDKLPIEVRSNADAFIGFICYHDGNEVKGVERIELPDLSYATSAYLTSRGFMDVSIADWMLQPLITTINWNSLVGGRCLLFSAPQIYHFEFRGAVQLYDEESGEFQAEVVKIVMRCIPKNVVLGKICVGEQGKPSVEYETIYMQISIEGRKYLEIDKLARIFLIDGKDYSSVENVASSSDEQNEA